MITSEELTRIPLFSTLADEELEYLARSVEDIRLVPGEYVSHEGDDRALFAVVEGKAEITKVVNGVERAIAVRLPGQLIGEIPMNRFAPAGELSGDRAVSHPQAERQGLS